LAQQASIAVLFLTGNLTIILAAGSILILLRYSKFDLDFPTKLAWIPTHYVLSDS
jgi:hypothetical protein